MTTTKTIDTATANEILDLDLDPSRVVSVDLELGAIDACSRHLNGTGPRVVAYPRTATGMLGTGAHPGFVSEISESTALDLGWTENEIFASAGANAGYQKDDQGPVCGDCQSSVGAYDSDKDAPDSLGVCWSCCEMIRESWQAGAESDYAG